MAAERPDRKQSNRNIRRTTGQGLSSVWVDDEMSSEKPNVLLIILNLNGEDFLEDCLDSIESNTVYPNFDTIVVDNGSKDSSWKIAEKRNCRLLKLDQNKGYDIGNNIPIYNNPDYDYYVLLNNDTEFTKEWLSNLVRTAEENNADLVGPKILNEDRTIQSAGFESQERKNIFGGKPRDSFEDVRKTDAIHGSAWMISRGIINKIGYLDEIFSLGNGEEFDYCARTKAAEGSIYVDGQSEVIHKEDLTKEDMDSKLIYLLTVKNSTKERLLNRNKKVIALKMFDLSKKFVASIIGYGYNPFSILVRALTEIIRDLPGIISKRRNRTAFIPSYYCEGIKDYSERYKDYQ